MLCGVCFCELYGDHRDLHLLTHSFPTRRSSDLWGGAVPSNCDAAAQPRPSGAAEGFVRPRIDRCGTRETFEPRPDFIRVADDAEQLEPRCEIAGLGRIQRLIDQLVARDIERVQDRKSTRLNSSN